jgi:hypothetical protein
LASERGNGRGQQGDIVAKSQICLIICGIAPPGKVTDHRHQDFENMHIGLIGGIGPAATDFYYRRLISTFASRKAALDLTIVHADTPTLLGNLASNNVAAQVAIYMRLTKRLAAAGAGCVVITSIAGHFCIEISSPCRRCQ